MKGVMKEDKLWQTGAFICQVHFCDHFTKVFLHQKKSTRKPTAGNLKTSKASGSLLACWKFLYQKNTWYKHEVDGGSWWVFQVLIFFRKPAPILETKCMERCYMHDLLTQEVATKLWFLRSWFGTCFAPALGDVWEDFHGFKAENHQLGFVQSRSLRGVFASWPGITPLGGAG